MPPENSGPVILDIRSPIHSGEPDRGPKFSPLAPQPQILLKERFPSRAIKFRVFSSVGLGLWAIALTFHASGLAWGSTNSDNFVRAPSAARARVCMHLHRTVYEPAQREKQNETEAQNPHKLEPKSPQALGNAKPYGLNHSAKSPKTSSPKAPRIFLHAN